MIFPGGNFLVSNVPVDGGGMLGSTTAAPMSEGSGGRLFWPSYQVSSQGGCVPRAGNRNASVEACGKMNGLQPSSLTASTSVGRPNCKNSCAVSKMCAPQSPSAPLPKSNHDRQSPWV